MSPWAWRRGLSASHTSKVCFTFLPSAISSLRCGNAAEVLDRPDLRAVPPRRSGKADAAEQTRVDALRSRSGIAGFGRMAVIVHEFDAACKIEAGEEHALAARQAGGGPQAESARLDAIDSARRRRAFRRAAGSSESTVHLSSPSVAKTRCSPSNRMVTLVRSVSPPRPSPTPAMPKTMRMRRPSPAIGPTDAHAHAVARRAAGHLRIASARLSSRGRGRARRACARAGIRRPRRNSRSISGRGGLVGGVADAARMNATPSAATQAAIECAMRHASTVARALYC